MKESKTRIKGKRKEAIEVIWVKEDRELVKRERIETFAHIKIV